MIFSFTDYKEYLRQYIEDLPKKGWGFLGKLATALDMQQAHISQIMSGDKDFSLEQGLKLSQYLKHNDIEKEYLLLLLQKARAGSEDLRLFFDERIEALRAQALHMKSHVQDQKKMSVEERMEFYSTWLYSAIRLYCSIDNGKTLPEIQKHFQIPPLRLNHIMDFLVATDLCFRQGDRYILGAQKTLIEKGTPLFTKHAANWRVQSILQMEQYSKDDLFLTSPMSLSIEDYKIIQEQIIQFMRQVSERVKPSKAEELACLNIDFFKF